MNEHTDNNDRLLQRSLADALGPEPLRDEEIERLPGAESAAAADVEQLGRILHGARMLVEQSASQTLDNRWSQNSAPTPSRGGSEITMKRMSDGRQDSRNRNPRGAAAALAVAAMSLLAVLFWTSAESERYQTEVAGQQAKRQHQIASIRRHWMMARTEPVVESPRISVGEVIRTKARERRRVNLPDGSVLYVNESATVTVATARRVEVERGEVFVEVVPQFDRENQRELFEVVTPTRTVTALGTKFGVDASGVDTEVLVTQGKVQVSGVKSIVEAGKQLTVATASHSGTVAGRFSSGVSHTLRPALRASEHLGWTRDLMVAAAGALVPASDYAGGAIITVDPGGQETKLSLRKYHVDVHIEDGFARTTIDQTYFNHTQSRLEGTFHFPLPPDASLSRLAMYVNGKLMEGGMAERDHARNTFEKIVHKMKDPALLEWVDGSTFRMRVFPLEARQEKRIVLSYTQRLNNAYGKTYYRFPAGHSMDVVRDWSTSVRVKNGGAEAWNSPSHKMTSTPDGSDLLLTADERSSLMNRDLVLELGTADAKGAASLGASTSDAQWCRTTHEGHQYLLLRYRPQLPGKTKRSPRHWVFLFEASADRNPLLARTQIEIIRTLLDNAEHSDTFNIVTANTKAIAFSKKPLKCSARNIAKAKTHLDQIHLIGALDLQQALTKCGELCDSENETFVVHTGSAIPVLGAQDQSELLRNIPDAARYVGVGVGKLWSRPFMKEAASRSGGYFTQINPDEEVCWRAFELSSLLNTPRLLNVKVLESQRTQSGAATFLNFADTIVQGEEICAVTRHKAGAKLPKSVVVTGLLNGKPWKRTLQVKRVTERAEHLPRSWAKLQIDRLIADGAAEHRSEIIRLSKSMYVMSPFTSLLVLENEEMYTQHNIDRGRKDHWALYACPDEIDVVRDPLPTLVFAEPDTSARDNWRDTVRVLSTPRIVSWSSNVSERNVDYGVTEMLQRGFARRTTDQNRDHYLYFSNNDPNMSRDDLFQLGVTNGGFVGNQRTRFGAARMPALAGVEREFWSFEPNAIREGSLNLHGEVNLQAMSDLGILIIKGNEVDVDSVERLVGKKLERANVGAMPEPWLRANSSISESGFGEISLNATIPNVAAGLSDLAAIDGLMRHRGNYVSAQAYSVADLVRLSELSDSFVSDINSDGFGRAIEIRGGLGIPDVPLGMIMEEKEKLQRQIAFNVYLKEDKAGSFLSVMNDVELSLVSPTVEHTLDKSWMDLSGRREVSGRPLLRRLVESERKIERSLGQTVSLHFHNASLLGVIRQIATTFGMNIVLDTQAIEAAGLTVDQRVSIDVDGVTLQSALNLLLDQTGGLVYVLDNDVLKITTRLAKSPEDDVHLQFGRDPRFFCDLMSHAPGLNTSIADVLALAETISDKAPAVGSSTPKTAAIYRGRIAAAAKKLIDGGRSTGWERITFPAAEGQEAFSLLCDGAGRYAFSRIVSEGLREEVLCDGESLKHVYSDIGLASERAFSRFHRRTIESLVPWLLPPVEELARDANVMALDEHTVAVVPVRTDSVETAGPVFEVHYVFSADDRLEERRLVFSDSKKVALRTSFGSDGTVRMRDGDNNDVAAILLKREATETPTLELNDARLVVLPMPIRSSATVLKGKAVDDGEPDLSTWSKKELMTLILADTAEGNGVRVANTIDAQFFGRNDRRDGLYVLLSRFPKLLVREHDVTGSDGRKRQVDLRPSPEGSPLRQFVRQYISWMLHADRSVTEFAIEGPSDGFVQRLAEARNQFHRCSSGAATKDRTTSQIKTELQRALKFVASCRTDAMGWTLLSVIHPRIEAAELNEMFADVAAGFEDNPQLAGLVRQERVKAMFKAGRHEKARGLYAELLRVAVRLGSQPRIAVDIREQFVSHGGREEWSKLVVACGSALTKAKLLRTAFLFSVQLSQLGDTKAAGQLMEQVLAEVTAEKRPDVTLLAVEHLRQLADGKADELMESLLDLEWLKNDARLWRYAARVADDLGHRQTALRRLEHAIHLEFQNRPDVIDGEKLRAGYTDLLTRFEQIIDAATTLETAIPEDMFARIIRAADQWRSLTDDATTCCHLTAGLLAKLNQTDLAWSYLTTPLAGRSGESAPWRTLADKLTQQEEVELADMAWSRAFEFEQTNPEILLSHAKMLAAHGRDIPSRRLLKQIVDSNWQPRFARVQQQAKSLLP